MGGDHKCPLCSATFTRPQHVGRHLRAHTGDRPYECKECPLRFARSDLLSRHVNKTHRPPEEGGKAQPSKKGRRKSMPSSAHSTLTKQQDQPEPKHRRASFDVKPIQPDAPASASDSSPPAINAPPAPVTLQAQSMYPHHPLLAGTPLPGAPNAQWSGGSPPMGMSNVNSMSTLTQPFSMAPLMTPMQNQTMGPNGLVDFKTAHTGGPMRISESDQGVPNMYRGASLGSLNAVGYEFGFKKKACDQCNHSKVRCDFGVPCHRCSHRNLSCTYNKPQKSRSIITTPSQQRLSSSPASHFSSPTSDPSPVVGTIPPPHAAPGQPVYGGQPMYDHAWMNSGGTLDTFPALQQSPQNAMFASPSTFGSAPNAAGNLRHGHRHSGSSSQSSGLQVPSLTSSTSPSTTELSEPANSMAYTGVPWITGKAPTAEPASTEGFATATMPQKNNTVGLNAFPQDINAMGWASRGQMTVDPRQHRSDSIHSDTGSDAASSSHSIFHDPLDDTQPPQSDQELRRASFSAGAWANAFHQMSLQDPSMQMPTDPFTASQVAQQINSNRPSFPGVPALNGQSDKMPSLGDVKDLWKLFMSEPMSGPMHPSSSNGPADAPAPGASGSSAVPIPGQRPTLARGMSKSNSMPDLTSPLAQANNQAFFSTYMNGPTPKPTVPQGSYTQPQVPEPHGQSKDDRAVGDEQAMKRWKDQLKNRQNLFEFAPKLNSKLAKSATPPDSHRSPPGDTAGPQSATGPKLAVPPHQSNVSNRPMASVIQGALDQTLAPERAPSFGVDGMPTPTKGTFAPRPSKLTSALARPGNKRLASQTLVPSDSGKKMSGSEQDGAGTGDTTPMAEGKMNEPFMIPHGLASGTGMTPGVNASNQFFTWPVPSGGTPAA